MKKRYTEEQIIKAIKRHESGVKVDKLCRELNISACKFYNRRSKYGGLEVNEAKRLKDLESENNKFKRLLADKLLEGRPLKKVVTPASRKPVVRYMIEHHGISRTGFRYTAKPSGDDATLERLKEFAEKYKAYGYLLLHALLKREGLVVNRKHTYRLCREEGLQVRIKQRKRLYRTRVELPSPRRLISSGQWIL